MGQSNGFELWRQLQLHFAGDRAQQFSLLRAIMQPSWNSDTRQFKKQYYKWLEDISRYESENGQGTINDHVKIATVVNNLKGNIAQNLMMKINHIVKDTHLRRSTAIQKANMETDKTKGRSYQQQPTTNNQQQGEGYPQQLPPYQQYYTQPPPQSPQYNKAIANSKAVVTTKVERKDKFQFTRPTTMTTNTTTTKRTHTLGTMPTIKNGFQRQTTPNNCRNN
eukprot:2418640-Amphidinium_carterae.2